MNRTIKEATVKRYHYESHEQLRTHLADFVTAYNFARRLKVLKGLSPYEYLCSAWTKEPGRFILDPIHQMLGLNSYFARSPDRLDLEDVRAFQVHLIANGISWPALNQTVCALRFFYGVTLGHGEIPYARSRTSCRWCSALTRSSAFSKPFRA